MTGRWRALLRLFAVQGAWSYERMLGVGMGYAAEPLLEDLKSADPARHAEAVVRSAEFFNSHPYLAGLALGASVRAEYDGVPGTQVVRLRTALCSPLGSLGDQVFWAGVLPALVALLLVGVTLGRWVWAIAGFLLVYNCMRLLVATWGLGLGLESGVHVGAAIQRSWLPRAVGRVGPIASFATGLSLPLVARWYLQGMGVAWGAAALALAAIGLLAMQRLGSVFTSLRFGLIAVGVALLGVWGAR